MTQNEILVPILTYHSLDSSGSVISTAPEKFREHMNHLVKSNLKVCSLSALAECLQENAPLPANSIAITFDDGFKSVHDVALPVLKEYGFTATVFLVTDFCGKNNQWSGQSAGIPRLDLLNWDQIETMAAQKIEFGIHTATHPDLRKLSPGRMEEEILGPRETLRERLGAQKHAFAYPYGKSCSAADAFVKSAFYAACSTRLQMVTPQSDVHFLPRLDMYYFSRNQMFRSLGTPTFEKYIRFRSLFRGVREALFRD